MNTNLESRKVYLKLGRKNPIAFEEKSVLFFIHNKCLINIYLATRKKGYYNKKKSLSHKYLIYQFKIDLKLITNQ